MVDFPVLAKFDGDEATRHRLPAYEAANSLVGISRTFVIVNHFLITGEVRKRTPYSDDIAVYYEPPQRGSLEAVFQFVVENPIESTIAGTIALNVISNYVYELLKYTWNVACGKSDLSNVPKIISNAAKPPQRGDLDALIDAIEPAARQAHTSIGRGARDITIIVGNNNTVTKINKTTADYLTSAYSSEERIVEGSIGSFNANQKTGSIFDYELGKLVRFQADRKSDHLTIRSITESLDKYAKGEWSRIRAKVIPIVVADGRTKRYQLIYARPIPVPQ